MQERRRLGSASRASTLLKVSLFVFVLVVHLLRLDFHVSLTLELRLWVLICSKVVVKNVLQSEMSVCRSRASRQIRSYLLTARVEDGRFLAPSNCPVD